MHSAMTHPYSIHAMLDLNIDVYTIILFNDRERYFAWNHFDCILWASPTIGIRNKGHPYSSEIYSIAWFVVWTSVDINGHFCLHVDRNYCMTWVIFILTCSKLSLYPRMIWHFEWSCCASCSILRLFEKVRGNLWFKTGAQGHKTHRLMLWVICYSLLIFMLL